MLAEIKLTVSEDNGAFTGFMIGQSFTSLRPVRKEVTQDMTVKELIRMTTDAK